MNSAYIQERKCKRICHARVCRALSIWCSVVLGGAAMTSQTIDELIVNWPWRLWAFSEFIGAEEPSSIYGYYDDMRDQLKRFIILYTRNSTMISMLFISSSHIEKIYSFTQTSFFFHLETREWVINYVNRKNASLPSFAFSAAFPHRIEYWRS